MFTPNILRRLALVALSLAMLFTAPSQGQDQKKSHPKTAKPIPSDAKPVLWRAPSERRAAFPRSIASVMVPELNGW